MKTMGDGKYSGGLNKTKVCMKKPCGKVGSSNSRKKSQLKEIAEQMWHETSIIIEVMDRGRRIWDKTVGDGLTKTKAT